MVFRSVAVAGQAQQLNDPVQASGLPPVPCRFVGRSTELRSLRAELSRPALGASAAQADAAGRVLLVAGRPGSGRTALALKLAHELAGRYPDGRLFARLTSAGGEPVPPEQVAREFLKDLGVSTRPAAPPDELTGALRRVLASRRALLVLDDVTASEQLLPLLPKSHSCLVVATTTGPLTGVADARPCVISGLELTAAVALLADAVGATRITCDPRGAEDLAEECACQPAALRLVGGWLAARPRESTTDAARHLRAQGQAGDCPGKGGAAALAAGPGQALARAFRLAHDGLPPAAARMLRLLTLAPAGLVDSQFAAALAGCSVRAASDTLRDLAGRGVLNEEVVPGPELAVHYRLPGCLAGAVREFLGRLDRPSEVRLAKARMLERTVQLLYSCHAALASQAAPDRDELRFSSAAAAASWLDSRRAALLAAATTAAGEGDFDTLARRLIAALVAVLSLRGESDPRSQAALYRLHGLLLQVASSRGRSGEQAAALINLADLDSAAGAAQAALGRYRAALAAVHKDTDGNGPLRGRALESIANTYFDLGDPQRAADWYGRALALRQSRGDLDDQARLRSRLGAAQFQLRRPEEALREWRAAAALYRRTGDLPARAGALADMAQAQECAGRAEDALRTCREALSCARQGGDARLEASMLLRMAEVLERLGDVAGSGLQRAEATRLLQAQSQTGATPK